MPFICAKWYISRRFSLLKPCQCGDIRQVSGILSTVLVIFCKMCTDITKRLQNTCGNLPLITTYRLCYNVARWEKGRYFMLKKKTLLIIPILLITLLTSLLTPAYAFAAENDYQPRLSAPSRSNAYYSSKLNVYFQSGYGMPNCVAYAYGRIYEMNGEAPKISRGRAGSWYSTNKRNGYY